MKVYFNQNFWSKKEGPEGIPQKVEWDFTFDNQKYYIPMLYHFDEGITMDIISVLDTDKIKRFIEEHGANAGTMSKEEVLYLESIHPIQRFPLDKIYINNELAKKMGSCSSYYIAGMAYEKDNDIMMNLIQENAFLQGDNISFQWIRVHIKTLKQSQHNIHSLKFITSKTEAFIPIKKPFKVNIDNCQEGQEESFIHPLSGEEYHIYINQVEKVNVQDLFSQYNQSNPFHFIIVSYEVEPLLSEEERLLLIEVKNSDGSMINQNDSAMSVGVISGDDDAKIGVHGYPLQKFATIAYQKSIKSIEISIAGVYTKSCSEEEILVYNSK